MTIFYAETLFNKKITSFQGNTSIYNLSNPNTISSPTLQLTSEQDISFYPPVYNSISYDTSVCAIMMENPLYTTTTNAQVN
jgi:hypothetical protein